MKRWQVGWEASCMKLCCFSPDCASQRCSECACSISRDRGNRAVCMECELRFAEPGNANCHDVVGYQLCSRCLVNSAVLHDHRDFCLITGSDGVHKGVRRLCGVAPRHAYIAAMCVLAPPCLGDEICMICYCPYEDADNPPCTWPGCTSSPPHNYDAQPDLKLASGIHPGKGYAHRDCIMQWVEIKNLSFCAVDANASPSSLCSVCQWVTEAAHWRAEFTGCVDLLREAFTDGRTFIEASDAVDLYGRIADSFEVAPVTVDTTKPLDLNAAAALLSDATAQMHPQLAIQEIMNRLCAELVSKDALNGM